MHANASASALGQAYDPYEASGAPKRYAALDKKAAFTSNTDRFRRVGEDATASLGPGAYVDNKGFADDVLKQRRRHGAFGSAGPRFNGELPKKGAQIPGGAEEDLGGGPGAQVSLISPSIPSHPFPYPLLSLSSSHESKTQTAVAHQLIGIALLCRVLPLRAWIV